MKSFSYVIKDQIGIHARPAGQLMKLASTFNSEIKMECKGKKANCKRLFDLMGLAAKYNDEITIIVDGNDEDTAIAAIKDCCTNIL
jgi:phosphocarrier protein HPr